MSTKTGSTAEIAASAFLEKQRFIILARNWRTRWCEIDIIARERQTVYFVEVKYRQNTRHGVGLDYVTPKKLQQMQFAAEFWLSKNQNTSYDYRLAALEVSGDNFAVTAWIDDIG